MRKSVLVLLLVATILVAHTEAGWFRKAFDTIKKAVNKVRDFVKKVRPFIGKRSVDSVPYLAQREQWQQEQPEGESNNLDAACLTFGITQDMRMDSKMVMDIFSSVDEDGDLSMNNKELEDFEGISEVMAYCMRLLEEKRLEGLSGPTAR